MYIIHDTFWILVILASRYSIRQSRSQNVSVWPDCIDSNALITRDEIAAKN